MKKSRYGLGLLAIAVGCLVNFIGDKLIGLRVELVYGNIIETFNALWFIQIFILPVLVGYSVTYVYGLGGKWLCYLPPLIVRLIAYYETVYFTGVPEGTQLMPMGWWGFFVILAIECAVIDGVLGEVLIKRIYGRSPKETPEQASVAESTKIGPP